MRDYKTISYTIPDKDRSSCQITLNRPDKYNAVNKQMAEELVDAFTRVKKEDSICVVVLTGAGEKAFCSGGDLETFPFLMQHQSAMDWLAHDGLDVQDAITGCQKVVIGKINGLCLAGGLEIALCCDLLYAKRSARFGLTEINMGILPGWGGTARLARAIPLVQAKEILFSGRKDYSAEKMYAMGLLTGVFDDDEFDDSVNALVGNISSKSSNALRMGKEIMDRSFEGGAIHTALALERSSIQWLINSPEIQAFFAEFRQHPDRLTKTQKGRNESSDKNG